MRQRTKRWGFDMGGEYILGIAKQEIEVDKERLQQTKKVKKIKKVKQVKNPKGTIAIITPWK